MVFGVCAGPEKANAILDAGFQYVEVAAVGFQGREDSWDPRPYKGLPLLATNVFFPGDLKIYSEDWRPYAQRVIERAATLGVRTMVIGSGAARRSTLEVPQDEAQERFLDLVAACQEMASYEGIIIAPESLERGETDVWNDLGAMASALDLRGLAYTADSFHVLKEWDYQGRPMDLDTWMERQLPVAPSHVHLGDLPRNVPDPKDPMVQSFVRRLRALEYDSTVSLECKWTSAKDAFAAVSALFA